MLIRGFIMLLITSLCFGCSFFIRNNPSIVYLAKDINFQLLGLAKIEKEINLRQNIKGNYQNSSFRLNLITHLSKKNLTIRGFTAFGIKAFTLKYDGKNIDFELSSLIKNSAQIKPEYILADIQLIYYPIEDVRKNIKGNITVFEYKKGHVKRVFYRNNVPILEVIYSSNDLLNSEIHYKNILRNYQYTIFNI